MNSYCLIEYDKLNNKEIMDQMRNKGHYTYKVSIVCGSNYIYTDKSTGILMPPYALMITDTLVPLTSVYDVLSEEKFFDLNFSEDKCLAQDIERLPYKIIKWKRK